MHILALIPLWEFELDACPNDAAVPACSQFNQTDIGWGARPHPIHCAPGMGID
jgi:hypothetical protein